MTAKWPIKTIAECSSDEPYSTQIGPFGKALMAEEYRTTGVPVLRGINVNRGRFHDDDFVYISDDAANALKKFESFPNDVLLVHKGTLGKIGLMPEKRKYRRYIMGNSMLRVRCEPSKLLPEYLYYWLSSPQGQHYLFSRVSQVGVPQLQSPLKTLREARLPVPPISEQREITAILSSLDNKIDLIQTMNETLEAIPHTLFKSWFLDFDPVESRANGRKSSGLSPETLNLFPHSFEETSLRKIPKGWAVHNLSSISDFVKGVSYRSSDLRDSSVALVTLKSIARGGGYKEDGLKPYAGTYKPSQVLLNGDVVVAHTDVTQNAEVLGKAARVRCNPKYETLVASLDLVVVRPKDANVSSEFLYCLLTGSDFNDHARSYANGTTVLHLSSRALATFQCVIPPPPLLKSFADITLPIFRRLDANAEESRILTTIRDTLIPRLLSGVVSVKETSRVVGGHV